MGPPGRTGAFLGNLRASGLLDEDQLRVIERRCDAAGARPSERSLARDLVDRGVLTEFQAQRLLAGRTQGFLIGPYTVLDRIGAGGMGRVYKAVHRHMRRVVALKVLPRSRRANAHARARFMREVRVGARLNHPNIVIAHDVGEEGDVVYLVTEYVEGQDVARLLKAHGRLPPAQAADIAYQVALGLEHARQRGIVHRDIKPSNILVTPSGTAKVLDMGLAAVAPSAGDAHVESALTKDGALLGTIDYLAPEQARDTHQADTRADLYSLGCTLYRMLTGRVPFPGGSATEKLLRHQEDTPVSIAELAPDVPAGLAAIVNRLMAKRPEDRYPTPAAAAAALLPWVGPGAERSDAGTGTASATPPPEPPSGSQATASTASPDEPSAPTAPTHVPPSGSAPVPAPAHAVPRRRVWVWVWAVGAAVVVLLVGLPIAALLLGRALRTKPTDARRDRPARGTATGALDWGTLVVPRVPTPGPASAPAVAHVTPAVRDPRPGPDGERATGPATAPTRRPGTVGQARPTTQPGVPAATRPARAPDAPKPARGEAPAQVVSDIRRSLQASDLAEARRLYVEAGKRFPDDRRLGELVRGAVSGLLSEARKALADDKPEKARQTLERLLVLDPDHASARKLLSNATYSACVARARATLGARRWTAARKAIDEARACRPEDPAVDGMVRDAWQAQVETARRKLKDGEYMAASTALEGAMVLRPDDKTVRALVSRTVTRLMRQARLGIRKKSKKGAAAAAAVLVLSPNSKASQDLAEAILRKARRRRNPGLTCGEARLVQRLDVIRRRVPLTIDNTVGMALVFVPSGTFMMGSPRRDPDHDDDEVPEHKVTIGKAFYMGTCEVTNAQFRRFRPDHDSGAHVAQPLDMDQQPVVEVAWDDATAFCRWLSAQDGKRYRLPTEAEWEYACRAGGAGYYQWGDDPGDGRGWCNGHDATSERINRLEWQGFPWDDGVAVSSPVGRFRPNAWGLYDMHGNVCEWCQDWYDATYYQRSPPADPSGSSETRATVCPEGKCRVLRGGSWYQKPSVCRSAKRDFTQPFRAHHLVGFRVVCEIAAPPK